MLYGLKGNHRVERLIGKRQALRIQVNKVQAWVMAAGIVYRLRGDICGDNEPGTFLLEKAGGNSQWPGLWLFGKFGELHRLLIGRLGPE